MQIIQWLSNITVLETPSVANSRPLDKKQAKKDQKVKSNDIVAVFSDCGIRRKCLKRAEKTKLNCENLNLFYLLQRKDISKACFHNTLSLKRLYSMKIKREDNVATKADNAATHAGNNKVLPITDHTAQSSSAKKNQCPSSDKKEKTKGDKMKTISRMKELLKWAAATKAEKSGKYIGRKVLLFRNRSALKAVPDDDQLSSESPKISFRWEVESCSTTSSVYSAISAVAASFKHDRILSSDSVKSTPLHVRDQSVAQSAKWITTDSEFVVLEL